MRRLRCDRRINPERTFSGRRSGRHRGQMQSGTKVLILVTSLLLSVDAPTCAQESEVRELIEWSAFGELPGTAFGCAGVSNGALILVGDSTYVIETESLEVQTIGAGFGATYSISASWGDEVLCIGEDSTAVALRWQDRALRTVLGT